MKVRAGGSEPITIAQVQVDEAYWSFTQDPPGALDHLSSAWLHIPYPWVLGEKHEIKVLTKTGTTFKKDIDVAVATPQAACRAAGPAGVARDVRRHRARRHRHAVLSGDARHGSRGAQLCPRPDRSGCCVFLLADSLEGRRSSSPSRRRPPSRASSWWSIAAALAFLVLFGVGRRHGTPTGLALATYIALGIGLHNLGEGLAIGAAFAAGVAGLGVFLVLGFTLHNVTEGIGIVAPLADSRPVAADLCRACTAGGRAGDPRDLARQPELCTAMVCARAGNRRRRDPAGHRRGRCLLDAQRRQARCRLALAEHARRPRRRHRRDVRHGHAGQGLIQARPVAVTNRLQALLTSPPHPFRSRAIARTGWSAGIPWVPAVRRPPGCRANRPAP